MIEIYRQSSDSSLVVDQGSTIFPDTSYHDYTSSMMAIWALSPLLGSSSRITLQ